MAGVYCKYKCGTRLTNLNMLTHEAECPRNDRKFSKDLGIQCRKEIIPFGTCTSFYDKNDMMEYLQRKMLVEDAMKESEGVGYDLVNYFNHNQQALLPNNFSENDQQK